MPHRILSEDWTAYESYKIEVKKDHTKIDFNVAWEVGHLTILIEKHFPHIPDREIHQAIYSCGSIMESPAPREKVIEHVVKRLSETNLAP